MTTIINSPPSSDNSGGPVTMIVIITVLAIFIFLGFIYGVPALKRMQLGAPQINVPDKIDINVNQTK